MKFLLINTIIISICVFLIIILCFVVSLNYMEEKINNDCKEQDKEIINYWDFDVNCSQFLKIKDYTTMGLEDLE